MGTGSFKSVWQYTGNKNSLVVEFHEKGELGHGEERNENQSGEASKKETGEAEEQREVGEEHRECDGEGGSHREGHVQSPAGEDRKGDTGEGEAAAEDTGHRTRYSRRVFAETGGEILCTQRVLSSRRIAEHRESDGILQQQYWAIRQTRRMVGSNVKEGTTTCGWCGEFKKYNQGKRVDGQGTRLSCRCGEKGVSVYNDIWSGREGTVIEIERGRDKRKAGEWFSPSAFLFSRRCA